MEAYAAVLTYAIPGFVGLILVEFLFSRWLNISVNRAPDTISSLSSGMTNTLKDILGLAVVIVSYGWMVDHLAIFTISSPIWLYITCFVLVDFASYWSHRFNHEINVMWNRHIIHHSSEEFNLSCALRQSISGLIGIYFFLSIPMAIVGIPTSVLAVVAPLHLFAQFWYHTRLIRRMGWLEYVIVTPSHHRVHHAINQEYIDKNYAAIFIIWDKLFGTFKEEDLNIPPVYGVKKPVNTWNPFIINYQHLYQLIKDAYRTTSWVDKIKIWFMPTGWRPSDVSTSEPIDIIEDVYAYEKYDTNLSQSLIRWSWFQLAINNILLYYLLYSIANLGADDVIVYSIFIALAVFSYTSLMDKEVIAIPAELIKFSLGVMILAQSGWFGINQVIPIGKELIAIYLLLSLGLTVFFTLNQRSIQTSTQSI